MREITYTDSMGRKFKAELPDHVPDELAQYSLIIGPPLLNDLNLPIEIEVRLHNELFARGIFTKRDARKRRSDIVSALASILAVDADKIVTLYD